VIGVGGDVYWHQQRALSLSSEEADRLVTVWREAAGKKIWAQWIHYLPLAGLPDLKTIAPFYYDWLAHPTYDSYWASIDVEAQLHQITVPVLFTGGWYDHFAISTVRNFQRIRADGSSELSRQHTKLVMRPTCHGECAKEAVTFGMSDPPQDRGQGVLNEGPVADELRWWDRWLKGTANAADQEPPVKLYVMVPPDTGTVGSGFWIGAEQYPLPGTRVFRFNLRSRGRANTLNGDGVLNKDQPTTGPPDRFVYDPSNPVPTVGASSSGMAEGALNQVEVEKRNDVLVYTSALLHEDLAVIGSVRLTFWARSSAKDTSFAAKLVDVHPGGYAQLLMDRMMHARYRNGSRSALAPIARNRAYEYMLYLGETATIFRKGHAIRLEISSSNFPKYARNLNTGGELAEERTPQIAAQTILHDANHPSYLELPTVPGLQALRISSR